MGNTAKTLRRQPRWSHYWSSVEGRGRVHRARRKSIFAVRSHSRTMSAEVAILGGLLIALQILDGVLTGLGMHHFGTDMEGNLFLRSLMNQLGFIPALLMVKCAAIGVISGLCMYAWKIRWLRIALQGIIGVYITCAVLPWMCILVPKLIG